MKSPRLAVGLFAIIVCAAPAGAAFASGGGGGGGGGLPSGAGGPQYNPAEEAQAGAAALQAGKYKEAVTRFERVTDAAPRVAVGWYMLGMAKAGAGDDKGAVRAYERAVKLDPAPIDPHRDYAVSLARLKQADKASAQLDLLKTRATACNDACPEAADLKAAIDAVQQAVGPPAAAPATPTAAGAAAATPAPAASPAASPAAAADPPSTKPLPALLIFAGGDMAYVQAVSLINERRYGEAMRALEKAETVFGPHPDILTYKGYVSRKLGRLDAAEAYYRQALALAPGHRGATEYYGELKVVRGDLAGARAMLAALDAQCAFGCVESEDLRRWIERRGDPAS